MDLQSELVVFALSLRPTVATYTLRSVRIIHRIEMAAPPAAIELIVAYTGCANKKNPLEKKILYFSRGSTDFSQTFRLCM